MKEKGMRMHVALLDAVGMKELKDECYRRISVRYDRPWWWNRWKKEVVYSPRVKFEDFTNRSVILGGVGFCLSGETGKHDMFADHTFNLLKQVWPGDTLDISFGKEFIEILKKEQKSREVEYIKN